MSNTLIKLEYGILYIGVVEVLNSPKESSPYIERQCYY